MSGMASDLKEPIGLVPRDHRFRHDGNAARWYIGGDPVPSVLFSALSGTFPLGEKFFIDSVRRYRHCVDSSMAENIDRFIVQEALHTREHLKLNRLIRQSGYTIANMTERTRRTLAPFRKRTPLRQVGLTMALEHFTALLAHEVLTNEDRFMRAPASVRALWRWHALEEIEHKAVAFDTFQAATKSWSRPRRYLFRIAAMMEGSVVLFPVVGRNMNDLFRQDKLPPWMIWRRVAKCLLGRRGLLWSILPGYWRWFKPGFHPWQIDDRMLMHKAADELTQGDPLRSARTARP
ncbi:metal-dependent hydrolase [Croceicoccus hydrothermalis]|uniref:metal-dependent hydrolase n=1 Tax=Croceicoccus hydrothermalis TaxID=2867964 RepID=UPI001EFA673E|nr:metal-dependent hydrolase [Croceicoccus hydrothermalis]